MVNSKEPIHVIITDVSLRFCCTLVYHILSGIPKSLSEGRWGRVDYGYRERPGRERAEGRGAGRVPEHWALRGGVEEEQQGTATESF